MKRVYFANLAPTRFVLAPQWQPRRPSKPREPRLMTHPLRNLRWYCLGFGFFWSIPLSMMCGVPGIAAPSGHWLWFVWVQQLAVAAFLPCLLYTSRCV